MRLKQCKFITDRCYGFNFTWFFKFCTVISKNITKSLQQSSGSLTKLKKTFSKAAAKNCQLIPQGLHSLPSFYSHPLTSFLPEPACSLRVNRVRGTLAQPRPFSLPVNSPSLLSKHHHSFWDSSNIFLPSQNLFLLSELSHCSATDWPLQLTNLYKI